ncbi:uncharacterized protein LOC143032181 [Oratosquilla oratoria]|uniref:uncharacterized protein LOC143032181 n=1 Tax=Oratosquilla oratoria TaxID=337810 RepID=UPI003F759B2E
MASFDVKALFTRVPEGGAMKAVKEAVNKISENEVPVSKSDYIKLISICISFYPFTFNGKVYRQHQRLAMGSPLSAVMASLFMELLERDEYIKTMGRNSTWCRYVDDVISIYPRGTNIANYGDLTTCMKVYNSR